MGEHDHDLNALAEKAKVIAEGTGRCEEDVLADLLDDGKANLTAGADAIEKHFLDKATEQAEKFKKLLTTLIPIIVLLGAVGAEGIGLLDMTSWGNESMFDEDSSLSGCMDINAKNYDSKVTDDDGSCDFGIPPCDNWNYEDYSTQDDNVLFLKYTFFSETDCGTELKGHFKIVLLRNDSAYRDANLNVQFTDEIEIEYIFDNLSEGNYYWELEFHTIECDDGTCEHGDEYILDQKPIFHVEAEVILGCIDESANNYNESATQDDGSCEYDPEIIEGCTNSTALNYNENATVDDGSCEYPPPRCEIVLYEILMTYNNTSAVVQYDLDCGTGENDQDGYNVSVQFWNSENDTSLNYTIGFHYIKGYVADIQELCLENLTAGKYDFHWIAIWTDDEGEQRLLEVNWSDIEITG